MPSRRVPRLLACMAGAVLAAACGDGDDPGEPAHTRAPVPASRSIPRPVDIVVGLRTLLFEGETVDEMARLLAEESGLPAAVRRQIEERAWDAAAAGLAAAGEDPKLATTDVYWALRSDVAKTRGRNEEAASAIRRAIDLMEDRAHASYHGWRRARALGLAPPPAVHDEILGVVAEIGYAEGLALVAGWKDGHASLYLGSGGGVLGGGAHELVRAAARQFVAAARTFADRFEPVEAYPLPDVGEVRFTVLTPGGARAGVVPKVALDRTVHPLTPLYAAMHELLTQLRLFDEARQSGR